MSDDEARAGADNSAARRWGTDFKDMGDYHRDSICVVTHGDHIPQGFVKMTDERGVTCLEELNIDGSRTRYYGFPIFGHTTWYAAGIVPASPK
jgi:hypothetical protein